MTPDELSDKWLSVFKDNFDPHTMQQIKRVFCGAIREAENEAIASVKVWAAEQLRARDEIDIDRLKEIARLQKEVREAVLAEREACAKLAGEFLATIDEGSVHGSAVAEAIRARSNP